MAVRMIAIDGPAGAGKSTVARLIANRLNYLYIDTGAMYRALALLALRLEIALDDDLALTALANEAQLELRNEAGKCLIFLDGEDVSEEIRAKDVGDAASAISVFSGVREALVAQQQRLGAVGQVVMDGRDIGTHVLPDADCKIFLTATLPERARRRLLELQSKGLDVDFEQIQTEMAIRDARDSNRVHSPLRQAADAVLVDSSDLSLDQVIEKIIAIIGGQG